MYHIYMLDLTKTRQITITGPTGGSTTINIPDDSVPIPPSGLVPGTQPATIVSIREAYSHEDATDLTIQQQAYSNWLAAAGRDRDLGMPESQWPAKPVQGTAHLVNVAVETNGTAWVWVTASPLGSPCPDLPPVTPTQPTPGTVQIGNHNYGLWWAQGPLDNPTGDTVSGKVFQGTSLDGVSGSWMFVASPMSSGIYGTKGWYMKVS